MELDKFYTKDEVAKECISLIPDISSYDLIIEPSAGSGAFSRQIDCLAFDIVPECEGIIQQNWLDTLPFKDKSILVLGNPPFGIRGSLAKDFIKHSQKIGAETIAFILPDTFSKISNQSYSLFSKEWKLIVEYKLDKEKSFFITEKGFYKVPCSFFIWTKKESNIDLRKKKLPFSKDFCFLPREDKTADFSINGNSGKIRMISEITNPKAEHYIKAKEKTKEELITIFSMLKYDFKSSINGGNAWIGQQEILQAYYNYLTLI